MVAIIRFIKYLGITSLFLVLLWGRPSREHKTYFKNTVQELNIYKIYGEQDGNTALILGGIQGDEPGGFRSAELYSELSLEQGNLIVVPRTNFHSIIKNKRAINFDMNRRFINSEQEHSNQNYEDKIVEIIIGLMEEADILLNLHDGWGFYSKKRVGPGRNPQRFGQSIIADTRRYIHNNDTINLKKMAQKVIKKANTQIDNPKHHLSFMNTETFTEGSQYSSEMKRSATYYALTEYKIPAFGIEASKNIKDLKKKIKYHNYAINGFLDIMDIKPEFPAVEVSSPKIQYLHISINGERPVCVQSQDTLYINQGDSIEITNVISNYEKGLSVDIEHIGSEQDYQKNYIINTNTRITLKRDSNILSNITLRIKDAGKPSYHFVIKNDNHRKVYSEDSSIYLHPDSKFKVVNVYSQNVHGDELSVNIKGYVPPTEHNTGEDRNYWVRKKDLWTKYSTEGRGQKYPIIVKKNDKVVSKINIIYTKSE